MGEDGHFASIFPNDNDSLKAIKGSDRSYICENKNITHSRITLSLKMIAKSEKIFLLVTKTRILKMLSHAKSVLERVENIMTSKM